MGSYGGAGQGGASCLHLATPKALGVSGCRAPLGLGAGDAGRAAGAGKFSVCRASEGKEKGEGAGDAAGEGGRLSSGEGLRDSTGPGRSLGPLSRSLQASRSPRPRTGHAQATPAPHGQGGLACLSPLLPRASVCCCRPAELSRRLPHFSCPISRARHLCLPPTSALPLGAGDASAAVSADRTLQKGRADGGRMKGPEAGVRG